MTNRTLTILLADLVGSSAHLTAYPQKQAVDYLLDATAPMRDTIEAYRGTIVKFTGDGYLATFDCVADALHAAEKIRHSFLRQSHTPAGISLDGVRIIINIADVTVQDNDVMGDGVALVSRLEKDVPTNQVYVTHAVVAIADEAEFSFEPAGEMLARGWHRPVKVYQLLSTDANFVEPGVFLLITDLHGLIKTGENLPATVVNQWLLTWGDMHRQAVSGLKGRVRQFIADMALITFASADDAVQGVLTLRALAEQHNARCTDLPPIYFAAAISTGDLILSPTGVVGRLVNQTFRLLKASPRRTVTIDKPVYAQLSTGHDRFDPVTRIDDSGIALELYELLDEI
ncbi:MAG: hypothetical protein EHM39_12260, partial [Chloroflexi bacterium]